MKNKIIYDKYDELTNFQVTVFIKDTKVIVECDDGYPSQEKCLPDTPVNRKKAIDFADDYYEEQHENYEEELYNAEVPVTRDIIRVYVKGGKIYIDYGDDISCYSEDTPQKRDKAISEAEYCYEKKSETSISDNMPECSDEDWQDFVEYFSKY